MEKKINSEKKSDGKFGFEIKLHYFKNKEFNCPTDNNSWRKMDLNLLLILDKMRHRSGCVYKITSAYRTPAYNATLKNSSPNSAHCLGKAVDIAAPDSHTKFLIIESALYYGIERIGVGSNFIHIDIQEKNEKPTQVIWTYY
tara:strand:+ start:1686 stop:2111 length:426 start_codon:yes stop_codon:yes gene_type:complete